MSTEKGCADAYYMALCLNADKATTTFLFNKILKECSSQKSRKITNYYFGDMFNTFEPILVEPEMIKDLEGTIFSVMQTLSQKMRALRRDI